MPSCVLVDDVLQCDTCLVVHDPSTAHELELAVAHEALDGLLRGRVLVLPPAGEEAGLAPDERPRRVLSHVRLSQSIVLANTPRKRERRKERERQRDTERVR